MDELFASKHAQEVPTEESQLGEVWYIPHFAVRHLKKDKLRILFDCSAKYSGSSINDHLLQRSDQLNSLLGIYADSEKRESLSFAMSKRCFITSLSTHVIATIYDFSGQTKRVPLKNNRMIVHLFGATSSPAVATYGFRKLASVHASEFPEATSFIQKDFYVNDDVTIVKGVNEAKNLVWDPRNCVPGVI